MKLRVHLIYNKQMMAFCLLLQGLVVPALFRFRTVPCLLLQGSTANLQMPFQMP